MSMTFTEIQNEVIDKYCIKIEERSKCYGRMHAHVRERKICKWHPKASVQCTFDLFHEIGHIETTKSWMRRAEEEYYATCWAIDRCKEYKIDIPKSVLHVYQRYVLLEVARGLRRGGNGYAYEGMNLYKYAGIEKTIQEFLDELEPGWRPYIVDSIKKYDEQLMKGE